MDMKNLRIEPYSPVQEFAIHALIRKVYDEYVAPDYPDNGNRFFYDWIAPENIAARQRERINLWTACTGQELAGMIEIRGNTYISLLFVAKEYHGRGIATRLFQTALPEMLRRDPHLEKVLVHASPYSIPVYRKMGFVAAGVMQTENGISYLPMEYQVTGDR